MNNIIQSIIQMDEDYLIALTNKGTVNRALKDLEKEPVHCEEQEESVAVTIGEMSCTLRLPVNESVCSCPSRSICKHIIMGILHLKEKYKSESGARTEEKEETVISEEKEVSNFTELTSISFDQMKKAIGGKKFSEAIHLLQSGYEPEISITSIVTVHFIEDQITVKLMEPFSMSSCTCQKKGFCVHKAQALLFFQKKEGILSFDEAEVISEERNREDLSKISRQIREFLEDVMMTGLSRTSLEITDSCLRMAVICHNAQLPNFERWFREISEEYNQYFKRMAGFKKEQLSDKIVHCYRMAGKLSSESSFTILSEIIGEFKSSYFELPNLKLAGVGCRDFKSETGYEGRICYFLELNQMEWYTFTKAQPTFYENDRGHRNNLSQFYAAPWNLACSLEELSQSEVHLSHAKVSRQHRISSSTETKGEIIRKSNIFQYDLKQHCYHDFKQLLTDKFIKNESIDENSRLVFVHPAKVAESHFDVIRQVLEISFYDVSHHKILLSLSFSQETKYLIRSLERIVKKIQAKKMKLPIFFGAVYIDGGELKLFPIDCMEQEESQENSKEWTESGELKEKKELYQPEAHFNIAASQEEQEYQDMRLLVSSIRDCLNDIFDSGFASLHEYSLFKLKESANLAKRYGLDYASENLLLLYRDFSNKRHQLKQDDSSGMERYCNLAAYLKLCLRRIEILRLKEDMTNDE